jgi:hypothetical protein
MKKMSVLGSRAAAALLVCTVYLFCAAGLHADDTSKEIAAPLKDKLPLWRVEAGSGALVSSVMNSAEKSGGHTLVPLNIAGVLRIDEVSLDNVLGGVLRGHTEMLFRGDYYQGLHGVENRMIGFNVGPRYNFVQPGWKIIPFVQGTVGILFADSNPFTFSTGVGSQTEQHGLGQDFNFTFGVAVGARYDFCEDWYGALSLHYMHVSNAGLSEPAFENKAIDAVGPQIAFGHNF